uniref:Secreted protein n=1 Tax=Knipowitschia caucasica TaxID=637954 RepID=A0AAV2K3F1_KNICA
MSGLAQWVILLQATSLFGLSKVSLLPGGKRGAETGRDHHGLSALSPVGENLRCYPWQPGPSLSRPFSSPSFLPSPPPVLYSYPGVGWRGNS